LGIEAEVVVQKKIEEKKRRKEKSKSKSRSKSKSTAMQDVGGRFRWCS
jgi:hypothetical protein